MQKTEIQRLIEFAETIRQSTLKRLRLVPVDYMNWSPAIELMSFADIANHLVESDEWLLKKIRIKTLEPIDGIPNSLTIKNKDDYDILFSSLEDSFLKKCRFIKNLDDVKLNELMFDERFGEEVSIWWIIVRGNFDHEIHHRGQISVYLRMFNQ